MPMDLGDKGNEMVNELGMAKKRDHKIMITNEAINKVPMIKYKEIPESEYLTIQELVKEVLTVSMKENNSNEVALTYSLDSQNLIAEGNEYMGIALGDEHGVDPCLNSVAYHLIKTSYNCVVIVLHNHPSLSNFSLDDVRFFLQNHTVKMIVEVTNLGSISYLVKKDSYDYMKALELYNESVNKHNDGKRLKDYQKAVAYFLSNCKKANIVYDNR